MINKEAIDKLMNIDFDYEKVDPIEISNDQELINIKSVILKCYYIGIYQVSNKLALILDSKKYYVVDTNLVSIDLIKELFLFTKPKKIVFGLYNYIYLLSDKSKSFIDIKLAFKILFNLEFDNINSFLSHFKFLKDEQMGAYLIFINFIKIVRSLSIYTEVNKINKYYYKELDTALLLNIISKRGVDFDKKTFSEYKNGVSNDYLDMMKNLKANHGVDVDFTNNLNLLLSIKEGIPSLNMNIIKSSKNKLLIDYALYNRYHWLNNLKTIDNKFYFNYNPYEDYSIITDFDADYPIYGTNDISIIKGEFGDIYYKTFSELTKNSSFISAASSDSLLDFINKSLFDKENELSLYTDIILKSYLMGYFEPIEIQEIALNKFDTILNAGDISKFNHEFKEMFPDVYSFIYHFDGLEPIYERYSKKILHPKSSLDEFIKQIINLMVKDTLIEVERLTNEYNKKTNDMGKKAFVSAVTSNSIIVTSVGVEAKDVTIDILNRTMLNSYRYFIKKTSVSNYTSCINPLQLQIFA